MAERRLVSNKWEIIRVIGHGGMGSVYEVRHTTLEIRRALKTLHPHLADDPEIVRRFLREGRNEARLEHPNIVRVYDFDTDPEFGAYLTMEMVEGRDLKMRMQQGPLSLREVLQIGSEVAAALDYAHSAVPPIVHRDIKPANILISDKTGTAKVTDFGIAKELADRETGVTGTQGFIGTIRYAAPEQVRADVEIDARVDLYSLGVVLYEMYSGKVFLDGVTPADIYRRTMMELDWQPPMVFPSPPPEEFAEVVRWCLQRQRADRIPSAREIVKCLQVCVETGAEHVQYQPVPTGGESPTVAPELAALSEPTAATVVSLVVEEDSTTIVGLRARIMRFRQELDPEVVTFSQLYAEATALGLSTAGVALPDDFSERLTALDEEVDGALDSRDRERLAHLFSRFEQLREEFVVGTGELRRRLADGIATAAASLEDAWRTLTDIGSAAVSPEARAAFDTLLQHTHAGTEAADWPAARETLSQARALLEQTRAAFVQQAEATVAELFSQAAPVVEELQGYLADATPDVDLAAIQSAAAADLAAGRADAAIGRTRDAVEQVRRELERRRGKAQELLAQQRDAADRALASVDADTAERIAPEDFRHVSEALASAREAETRNQLIMAAEHYREATESLERVRTRIAAQQAAELEQRLQSEREAAQGAEKAAAALAAVMQSLDVDGAQSVAAADLAAARELEAGARAFQQRREWAAATAGFDAAREAFVQLQERVARALAPQLAAASDDVRRVLEAAADAPAIVVGATREQAENALIMLRSAPSSAGLAAARAAVAALEQALQEAAAYRSATEQRTASEALHGRVNQLGLDRRQLRSVERLTKNAAAAFDRREWNQARDAYAQLHAQIETLERQAEQSQRLAAARAVATEARANIDTVTARECAADALDDAERAFEAAARTEQTGDPEQAAAHYDRAQALYAHLAELITADYARRLADSRQTLQRLLEAVADAPPEVVAESRRTAEAALAAPSADVREALAQLQAVRAALAAAQKEVPAFLAARAQRATAAARAAATRVRDEIDVDTARQCAAAALAEAEGTYARGTEAEDAGDFDSAVTSFEAAGIAYAGVTEIVAREYSRRLGEARTRLQRLLQNTDAAPAEVVGEARQRAQPMLADASPADARAALSGTDAACAALEQALSEVPLFSLAHEQQQRAAEAQARAEAVRPRPRRKYLKAAQALVTSAAAAAQRRDWSAMRDSYAQAADAFTEIERAAAAQPAPRSMWPRLIPVAGAVILVAAAALWQMLPKSAPTRPNEKPRETTSAAPPPVAQRPAPPPIEPWRIASAKPADEVVAGRENEPLSFAIVPAGGPSGATAKVEWSLDDARVQTDTADWTYKPGFDAAGAHTVVAKIDGGEGRDQQHTWKLTVENVNRAPVLVKILPDPKAPIDAKVGDSVVLKAEATDADRDDRLTYHWTVDGKPAGTDAPQLNIKVASNHTVGLTVSDGTDKAQTAWQIAALAPLVFDFSPKQLDSLRFKSSAEFQLVPPHALSLADISFAWALDGRKISDRPAFTLQATDATLVRATPVKITATASDKQGRSFSHDWKVSVVPPAPVFQSATPPTEKPIDAEGGQALAFQVAAAPTVGNQQLTYLFSVDGQKAERSAKPQFEFRVPDENEHRVVARVEDNYRQASQQDVTWRVQGSDILSQVRKWVTTFQEARRSGDAQAEGRLRDLSATEVGRLKDAYSKQKDLQVSFTAPRIEKLAATRARAGFTMTQAFQSPDGQQVSGRVACEFTLARVDGRLREEPRPQGPCVPVQ